MSERQRTVYPTACVGCKYASWFNPETIHGECTHPAAESAREALLTVPMSMFRRSSYPEMIRKVDTGTPGTCSVREAE